MVGSQALEMAIGLTLIFFLLASTASAVLEVISALLQKRAKDLEAALVGMLDTPPAPQPGVPTKVADTSSFQSISPHRDVEWGVWKLKWRRTYKPSYVSAKAFANSVAEIIGKAKDATATAEQLYDALPKALGERLRPIVTEVGADATAIKAELESWFDDTMERVAGSYKRWAQVWLFVFGLVIVVAANASAYRMGASLYADPAVRSAVTESATATAGAAANGSSDPEDIEAAITAVAETVDRLDSLGLPVGWDNWNEPGGTWVTMGGWLVTALLIMLGAPFWFGVLTKLVSLRSTGERPAKASEDEASATMKRARA